MYFFLVLVFPSNWPPEKDFNIFFINKNSIYFSKTKFYVEKRKQESGALSSFCVRALYGYPIGKDEDKAICNNALYFINIYPFYIGSIKIESNGYITDMKLMNFILSYYIDKDNNALYIKPYSMVTNTGMSIDYITTTIQQTSVSPSIKNKIIKKLLESMLNIFMEDNNLGLWEDTLITTNFIEFSHLELRSAPDYIQDLNLYFTLSDMQDVNFFIDRHYNMNPATILLQHKSILSRLRTKEAYAINVNLGFDIISGQHFYSYIYFIDFYKISIEDYIRKVTKQFYMYKIERIYYVYPELSPVSGLPNLGLVTTFSVADTGKNHADINALMNFRGILGERSYDIKIGTAQYRIRGLLSYGGYLWFNAGQEVLEDDKQKLQSDSLDVSAFFLMPSDEISEIVKPALVVSSSSIERIIEDLCHSIEFYKVLFLLVNIRMSEDLINKNEKKKLNGKYYYKYEFYMREDVEEISIVFEKEISPQYFRSEEIKIKIGKRTYIERVIIIFEYRHVSGEPVEYGIIDGSEGSDLHLVCKGKSFAEGIVSILAR